MKTQQRFVTIEDEYQNWADAVIPKDAGPIQRAEMKKTFYAGFASCLSSMERIAEFSDANALENMVQLREEAHGTVGNLTWHENLDKLIATQQGGSSKH